VDEQTDPEIYKCDMAVKRGTETMKLFKMPFGGKTLASKIKTFDLIGATFKFDQFIKHMLEMGAFMILHGFVHNDLHTGNILMDDSNNPRLIDYGRSYFVKQIDKKRVHDLSAKFEPTYDQVPPEVTVMDGIDAKLPFHYIVEQLRTKRADLRSLERILGIGRGAQVAELRRFWLQSRAARQQDWVSLYRLYWPVVDSWSIGHVLVKILDNRLLPTRSFREGAFWQQKGAVVKKILRGLMRMSPRERLDSIEALELLDPTHPMVSKGGGAEWLRKRRLQREQVRTSLIRMRGGGGGGLDEDGDEVINAEDDEWPSF
jgi:serine/threonine protein kinase